MKKEEIFEYVQKQYGTMPEYLWSKLSDSAVLRHKNGKWYVVLNDLYNNVGLLTSDPTTLLLPKSNSSSRGKCKLNIY